MKRAVFLDRDGVINIAFKLKGVPVPPRSINDLQILDGVKEAIKLLNARNFMVVVVTNQPDVARGIVTQESVETINLHLRNELLIKHFYTCFHDDQQGCDCRKPKPGLLQKAAQDLGIDLHRSYIVGDRWRDIAAGQAAGCECYFIDYEYSETSPQLPFTKVSSLIEATYSILEISNDSFD
jgi:D-glycero-D-manno-heptose 1,7-bisphosphate phosphatase